MKSKTLYRLLVATLLMLFLSIGIYIGMDDPNETEDRDYQEMVVSNTNDLEIYKEYEEEKEEELLDVHIRFTDTYPDCGHDLYSEEHHSNTTKEKVIDEVKSKDLGYMLVGEEEGIIIFKKVHSGKCMNHYKVILENNVVNIYRINENNEFALYQVTEVTTNMIREGIKEQLEEGIVVDDVEELFLLMEDIES